MPRIAVLGGTGYLASLIKNQNNSRHNKYFFFSRNKRSKNFINFLNFESSIQNLKKFDSIIYLLGPDQDQVKKKIFLIEQKNKITTNICNLCLNYNIKLICISTMQIYKNYGNNDILINSKVNLKNSYARSHYETEKIIKKIFFKKKNMFVILRLGNVFGFRKYFNLNGFKNNIVHELCNSSLRFNKIIVKNGNIQRTFIPSKIFVNIIDLIIKKKFYNNSIINISYKVYNLKEIAFLIKKRFKVIYNKNIKIQINKFKFERKKKIYVNSNFKFKFRVYNINKELDEILKTIKQN
jgi:nucleoside-diphosphate-sugar epimerase